LTAVLSGLLYHGPQKNATGESFSGKHRSVFFRGVARPIRSRAVSPGRLPCVPRGVRVMIVTVSGSFIFERDLSSFREKASENIIFFRKKFIFRRISGLKKRNELV
jgi:hypothetical protein